MVTENEIDFSRIHFSLAGSGNPWSALSRTSVTIMINLNMGVDLETIAVDLTIPQATLDSVIDSLKAVNLVWESDGKLRPSFLMTDEDETLRVYSHAAEIGTKLADTLDANYDDIKSSYNLLEVSNSFDFEDVSFLLLGGRIIDIKLLEKLVTGVRLLPSAPSRPSPDQPDAHYYFWMVEGEKKHLGEYGLNDFDLPWTSWRFYTFAKNLIDGKENPYRSKLETQCLDLVESKIVDTPEDLGKELAIPVVCPDDSIKFAEVSDKYAELLSLVYKENEHSIKKLHSTLKSGLNAPHSFGEFFCWYAHIAYSVAIEILEYRKVLPIPKEKFQAALWYREKDREGLLIGA